MKALSVHQPWAALIAWGEKRIEARSWFTGYRGPLLIVSTKNPKICGGAEWRATPERLHLYGHALGIVNVQTCRPWMGKLDCDLAMGASSLWAWVLAGARLVKPFPVHGRQGLYDVNDDLIEPVEGGSSRGPV